MTFRLLDIHPISILLQSSPNALCGPDGPCQGGGGSSAKAKNMTSEERLAITPDPGQLIYDTTLDLLFVGDGSTEGGVQVESTDQADFSRVVFHDPAE